MFQVSMSSESSESYIIKIWNYTYTIIYICNLYINIYKLKKIDDDDVVVPVGKSADLLQADPKANSGQVGQSQVSGFNFPFNPLN